MSMSMRLVAITALAFAGYQLGSIYALAGIAVLSLLFSLEDVTSELRRLRTSMERNAAAVERVAQAHERMADRSDRFVAGPAGPRNNELL
jgi:hypothetical protein